MCAYVNITGVGCISPYHVHTTSRVPTSVENDALVALAALVCECATCILQALSILWVCVCVSLSLHPVCLFREQPRLPYVGVWWLYCCLRCEVVCVGALAADFVRCFVRAVTFGVIPLGHDYCNE